jgi:hypothetical protein
MRTLHYFTTLTRFVLAWFVLSVGFAIISPILKPLDIVSVCTASGSSHTIVLADDGTALDTTSSAMDCPLCLSITAPPTVTSIAVEAVHPLAYALQSIPSAHIAARTAAPLPARGPPYSV